MATSKPSAKPTGNVFLDASRKLQRYAEQHEGIIVAYSGGKDSRCVLDLCCKTFRKVVCFHMYFVPGLQCIEAELEFARQRWGVEVLQYPHWISFKAIKSGEFGPNYFRFDDIPEITVHDIEAIVMEDTGISLIAHGGKKADSLWRRRNLSQTGSHEERVYPLLDWTKWDALSYLSANKIPIPSGDGDSKSASGIDFATSSILWLHDKHYEDFCRLEKFFPYLRAVVYRREFYGIE